MVGFVFGCFELIDWNVRGTIFFCHLQRSFVVNPMSIFASTISKQSFFWFGCQAGKADRLGLNQTPIFYINYKSVQYKRKLDQTRFVE